MIAVEQSVASGILPPAMLMRPCTAQALIRAQCRRLPLETVPIAMAMGRVLGCDLLSPVDLPPFANAAMDGFALRSDGCALEVGREFVVHGEQAAGDGERSAQGDGAWAIMTGAMLPVGLDTVVPVEQVDVLFADDSGLPARIGLRATLTAGRHVRGAGEDIVRGARAITAGTRIGPAQRMLLAGLGIAEVQAVCRPRVAVLCTGRELIDDPMQVLQPGQIRNSNAPYLLARLAEAGAEVVHVETVCDDADVFAAALRRALAAGAGLVLSTGAVSMGRHDFVPAALQSLGAQVLFHKLRMRPGKPLLFARLADGPLYFGLPGNPMSGAVGLRFFVEIALRAQLGLADERPWRLPLAQAVHKKPGLRMYQQARVQVGADCRLAVELLRDQESFRTRALLDATAWAALPEDGADLPAGTVIDVYGIGHAYQGILGEPMVGETIA